MKSNVFLKCLVILVLAICQPGFMEAQMMHIPHVPDLQQPILPWWGNLPENACAPVSAANICVYWDDIIHHSNAVGLNSGLIVDSIPSYLYFFMGTEGIGDPTRANPAWFGVTPGTITMDIDTGFEEYVRWDPGWPFYVPKPFQMKANKKGFNWIIQREEVMGFHHHMMEIDMRRPDIVVFKYWNPQNTGITLPSEMGGDSIHYFLWDTAVTSTGFPNPHEDYYFDEKINSAGHAVTGVGYLFGWDPDDAGPLPMTDWIICHDNWPTTPKNVAIPWVDSIWIATFSADPGVDSVVPKITCMDTTVYLDETGQFYLDTSYIVKSAWDNNGVEQLFLDEYYVQCHNTTMPKTLTATAMDMFGNMAQCQSSVTVIDTIRPIPRCMDTAIYLDANGSALIDSTYIENGSTDNCAVSAIVLSQFSFNCSDLGDYLVEVTVIDVNGNKGVCQSRVTVLDTIPPAAICKDTTLYLDATGMVNFDSSHADAGSTDNCGIFSISPAITLYTCTDIGTINNTITVNDAAGNYRTCEAEITILDTISPQITCTDTIVYLDSMGIFTIDTSYVLLNSNDNCILSHSVLSRDLFDSTDLESPQSVTVTTSDGSGNEMECQVLVTVLDTIPSGNIYIEPIQGNFEFRIWPNPANGWVQIESTARNDKIVLYLYGIRGELYLQKQIYNGRGELNLGEFEKGIYILKISEKGGREYQNRIVIK
jgi:hypothetical protein